MANDFPNTSLDVRESPFAAVGVRDVRETAFAAFGVRVGVSTNDPGVWSRLADLIPPDSRPCDPGDVEQHFSVVTNDGTTLTVRYDVRDGVAAQAYQAESYVATDVDRELALGLLDTHVHGVVAFRAPEHVFIGAGVVGYQGRAILMPGMALSGKTTLVTALVRAGCVYYSDQYAVLDERGRVHPYARPSLHAPDDMPRTNHRSGVGPTIAGETPLPVGAILATSYSPGAEWRPKQLSRGQGLLALLSHAVTAQDRTEQVMRAINRALDRHPIMVASERDDANAVVSWVLAELEGRLARPY